MKRRTVLAKKKSTERGSHILPIAQDEITTEPSADAIAAAAKESRRAELASQLKERYGVEFEVTSEKIQIWFANGQVLEVSVGLADYDIPALWINGVMLDDREF